MWRRQVGANRRLLDPTTLPMFGPATKPRSSSISIVLLITGTLVFAGYIWFNGSTSSPLPEGDNHCTNEVQRALPFLRKAYGDTMTRVLHVGPDSCSIVPLLQSESEAWGVEPYDVEDADADCRSLVARGIVRVSDPKFSLPYRQGSFSLVIVSDVLDYLSPKYLNRTLIDLARVASNGLVVFAGFPGKQRAKVTSLSKFGRPAKMRSASWWIRNFVQTKLEENEEVAKKFHNSATKKKFKPLCHVFHLIPHQKKPTKMD